MNNLEATTTSASAQQKPTSTNRLVFPHGVANLTMRVDESMAGTYRGEFYGPKPHVTEADGVVSIDYPRFNPLIWGRTAADITLNPSVAWAIDIRDGVSRWNADLRKVELTGIDVRGGVSRAELQLPRPTGSVRIRVSGGASSMMLRRPAGVAARIQIGGGVSKLALDDQFLGAVGGPVRLETPDYGAGAERYDVEIGGGASKVTVSRD